MARGKIKKTNDDTEENKILTFLAEHKGYIIGILGVLVMVLWPITYGL